MQFTVTFMRQADFAGRVAIVRISSDSLSEERRELNVQFVAQAPQAVAVVAPSVLNFGTVGGGGVSTRSGTLASTGTDDLVCNAFALSGHPDFTFEHPQADKAYPVSEVTSQKAELDPPIVVSPSTAVDLKMNFTPQTNSPADGTFVLFCNDNQLEGHIISIVANQDVPCIQATPSELLFGGKIVGNKSELPVTITNCGTADLEISAIRLSDDTDPDYTLAPFDFEIVEGAPLAIGVNDSIEAKVWYVPATVSPLDADNQPIPDVGTLLIENNSFEATVEVPITGTGVEIDCPVAIITIDEGEQVVPQTTLHLNGDQSYSPFNLAIKNWEWSVQQPEGSTSIFIPSGTHDNPVFTVNVAGVYTYCLTVRDLENNTSCEPTCIDVIVIPDEAIHVELTWTTAGDVDLLDTGEGKGADMDLHFAHPFADGPDIDGDSVPDPWFHDYYDSFWFFKTNNWGTFAPDVDDDPHLDLDDIDGWGPENLNLNIPESVVYRVGVHYWNHHCFGASLATVRVWLYGELVAEAADVVMENHDFWNVAEIDMSVAGLETVTILSDGVGGHLITPNYINANFMPPISNACGGDGETGGVPVP
ncbi:MAG: hypothetical protein ACI9WU_002999 [Myxococcota bacterium]